MVRSARAADLDRMVELWLALADHQAALDPAFRLRAEAKRRVRGLLDRRIRDSAAPLLVYDADGEILGLAGVRIDAAPSVVVEAARAEITEIVVCEGARRRGIGRALAGAALALARERGARRVEARVSAHNEAAQAFWRALGFGPFVDVLDLRL